MNTECYRNDVIGWVFPRISAALTIVSTDASVSLGIPLWWRHRTIFYDSVRSKIFRSRSKGRQVHSPTLIDSYRLDERRIFNEIHEFVVNVVQSLRLNCLLHWHAVRSGRLVVIVAEARLEAHRFYSRSNEDESTEKYIQTMSRFIDMRIFCAILSRGQLTGDIQFSLRRCGVVDMWVCWTITLKPFFLPCYRLVFVGDVITVEDGGWLRLDQHASGCSRRRRRRCTNVSIEIIFDELEITFYGVCRILKRQVFICWRQTNVGNTH